MTDLWTALIVPVIRPPALELAPPGRLNLPGALPTPAGPGPGAGPPAAIWLPPLSDGRGACSPPANPAAAAVRSARAAVNLVSRGRERGVVWKSGSSSFGQPPVSESSPSGPGPRCGASVRAVPGRDNKSSMDVGGAE